MILNVNKELGWTSFDVVAKIRNICKTKRVGHAGTLDPLAKGVLVVLTDADTKHQNDFLKFDKEYLAQIVFGVSSPTDDMEGPLTLVQQAVPSGLVTQLEEILQEFVGDISQKVPDYSAVKVKGKELYKYARAGVAQTAPTKTVRIEKIALIDLTHENLSLEGKVFTLPVVTIQVTCGSGVYIRALARDLGEKLKLGGVLFSLTRTRIGTYSIKDSVKIQQLEEQLSSRT